MSDTNIREMRYSHRRASDMAVPQHDGTKSHSYDGEIWLTFKE